MTDMNVMSEEGEDRRSRALVFRVNVAKLLALAALAPPATVGLAQRAAEMSSSEQEAGLVALISMLGTLSSIAGALALPLAADRRASSPRWHWGLACFGILVGSGGLLLAAAASSAWVLIAGWMIAQLGCAGMMAVLRTLLTFALSAQRRRGAVAMVLFTYLGALLPLVVLIVFPGVVWATALALALLATGVTAIQTARTPREPRTRRADDAQRSGAGGGEVPWPILLSVHFASNLLLASYLTYHALEIAEREGERWGDGTVRLSLIVLAAALVGLMLAAGLLLAKPRLLAHPRRILIVSGIALAASVFLRGVVDSLPLLLIVVFVSGAAIGANSSTLLVAILDSAPPERAGRRLGLYSTLAPIGQLAGPSLGLLIVQTDPDAGYRGIYLMVALLPVLWTALLLVGGARRRSPA